MIGKQLNTICKALQDFDTEVPLKKELRVLDPAHVKMLHISGHDGAPVLGVVAEDWHINTCLVLNMKVGDKEELEAVVDTESHKVTYRNSDTSYDFKIERPDNIRREIEIDNRGHVYTEIDPKTLTACVKQSTNISDHVAIESDADGVLWLTAENDDSKMRRKIGGKGQPCIKAVYPNKCLIEILKIVDGTITLEYDKDNILRVRWCDEWYSYEAFLAPRIEAD